MNKVMLIGNLASDTELRYTNEQKPICRFTLATNDGYGERQETNFHRVVCFGKTAENCDRFLTKGRKAAVVGKVKYGSYQKQDGTKVYTTDIVADNVEFIGGRDEVQFQTPEQYGKPSQADVPPGFENAKDDVPW